MGYRYIRNKKTEKCFFVGSEEIIENKNRTVVTKDYEEVIKSEEKHDENNLHYNEQDGFYTKETTQPPQPDEALAELRSLLVEWEDGDQDKADDRLNDILQSDKTLDLFVSQGNYSRFIQRLENGPASDLITTDELSEVKNLLNVEDTDNA